MKFGQLDNSHKRARNAAPLRDGEFEGNVEASADQLIAHMTQPNLSQDIVQIEAHVAALSAALRDRDARTLEAATQTLQRALAASIRRFAASARSAGGVPLPLRRRIAVLCGRLGAQRQRLAHASAALERALAVLASGAAPGAACVEARRASRVAGSGVMGA